MTNNDEQQKNGKTVMPKIKAFTPPVIIGGAVAFALTNWWFPEFLSAGGIALVYVVSIGIAGAIWNFGSGLLKRRNGGSADGKEDQE